MKRFFTMKAYWLLLAVCYCIGLKPINAQTAADYGFSMHAGTYPALSANALNIPNMSSWGSSVAINATNPFVFNYCGVNYDTFTFNSLGYMSFGLRHTSQYDNTLGNASILGPSCMVLWDDLYPYNGTGYVEIQGTAPYRVFVFEWKEYEFPYYSGRANIKFQIRLYETTNVIEYIYGPGANPASNMGSATVGIYSAGGNFLTLNALLNNATPSSSSFTTNIKYDPALPYGTIFRWTPPVPCNSISLAPIKLSAPTRVCFGDSVNLKMDYSAMPQMAYVLTYQYQYKDAPTDPWTNIGTLTSNRAINHEPITNSRYYRAEIFCNGSYDRATDSVKVEVGIPPTPVANDVTRCGYGTLTFNVQGPSIYWYDEETKANPVAVGNTFTTPMLGDTTSYYVSNAFNRVVKNDIVTQMTYTWQDYYYGPYKNYNESGVFQYIIPAYELTSLGYKAGNITAVSFNVTSATTGTVNDFNIRLGHTNMNTMSAPSFNNLTTVYTHSAYQPVNGWNKHEFQTPFVWDGTSNILVTTCWNNNGVYTNSSDIMDLGEYYAPPYNILGYYNHYGYGNCNSTAGYNTYARPNMKLEQVTGCESPRVKVNANVKPAPAFNANSFRPEVCYGDSTYLYGNSMQNPNYQYKWDGSNIVGNTYTVFPYLDSNFYTVKAFDSVLGSPFYGCEAYDTILVAIAPNPEVYLTPNNLPTVCPGIIQSVSAVSPDAIQYQWFFNGSPIHGATTPYFGTTQPGFYSVLVTDANGCDSMSDPVYKTISNMPSVSIGYNSKLEFCQGSSVILTIPGAASGLVYQWHKDGTPINTATDSFYEVTVGGRYSVNINDTINACNLIGDTLEVTVHALPNPTISRNGVQLETGNFVTYAWLVNNQYIAGETNPTLTILSNGVYCVEVTDSNGCMNRSPLEYVKDLRLEDVNTIEVQIYPNPTKGTLHIKANETIHMELYSSTGQLVYKKDNVNVISVDHLANGMYMLHIYDNDWRLIKTEKVTKY